MTKLPPVSDMQFRAGVVLAGIAAVAAISAVRFCGPLSLPAKPPPPLVLGGASRDLAARAAANPSAYQDFLARDAVRAGLAAPSIADMARALPYHADDARHVLEVDGPPLELAGLRLRALHALAPIDGLALEIENTTGSDLAYTVVSQPIAGANCTTAPVLPFNAMIVARGHRETRVECAWRAGIALAVLRIETLEVPPLSVWYLDHVAPTAVGIEPRIARGHHADTSEPCALVMPQAVRSGLERGEITWRDLADFYARHRCQTYQFPMRYRAFRSDGERSLPAAGAGM
ncbi:MAG TPA: hypothetical protein VFP84_34015 [Kofleriaceae bacterium]|nr:hypothetical protein [Kofleriaceae bacterium]